MKSNPGPSPWSGLNKSLAPGFGGGGWGGNKTIHLLIAKQKLLGRRHYHVQNSTIIIRIRKNISKSKLQIVKIKYNFMNAIYIQFLLNKDH